MILTADSSFLTEIPLLIINYEIEIRLLTNQREYIYSLGYFLKPFVLPASLLDFRCLHRMKRTVNDAVNSTTTKVYTANIHGLGFGLSFSVGLMEVAATIIKQTVLSIEYD